MKKIVLCLTLVLLVAGCTKKVEEVVVEESPSTEVFKYEQTEVASSIVEVTDSLDTIEETIEEVLIETTKVPETTLPPEATLPPQTTVIETTVPETIVAASEETFMFETTIIANENETLVAEEGKQYKVGDRKVENGKTYEYFKGPSGYYWEEAVVERDDPDEKDDSVVYNGVDDINDKPDWEE